MNTAQIVHAQADKRTVAFGEAEAATPLTVQQVLGQVALIQQIMKATMKEGEHYGRIPGCGNKPSLLKPGAEKLCLTFRLAPMYDVQERQLERGHREYRIAATLTSILSGVHVGQGVGSCSTLENKCRFIAQVMNGDATVRRAEDVDAAALTYAEVKAIASGNPLVIEKAGVDAEVARLTRLKKQHLDSQYQVRYRLKSLVESVEHCERIMANLRTDLATRVSTQGDRFVLKLKKETYTDRVKAGRALVFLAESLRPFTTTHPIGKVGGFPFAVQRMDGSAKVLIQGKADHEANISDNALGTVASVEKALQSMESRLESRGEELADYQRKREELGRHVGAPFEYEEKLVAATARQQEIFAALDLTKNQAGTQSEDGSAEEPAAAPSAAVVHDIKQGEQTSNGASRRPAMAA